MKLSRRSLIATAASLPVLAVTRGADLHAADETLPTKESRAIFCEGLRWVGRANAENVCDRIKEAGFNTIIACAWHGSGVSWPSKICPWWDDNRHMVANRTDDLDPFGTLVEVAHDRGLEIHAAFTVMAKRRGFYEEFSPGGKHPERMFDVHKPEFRDFIVSLMKEVIDSYPIDGFNLDYIRSGDGFYLNPEWVAKYAKDTGRDIAKDYRALLAEARKGESHPEAHAFMDWQEAAVGDIVRRTAGDLRKARPNAVLSAIADPFEILTQVQGRLSAKWADSGLIDVIYTTNYEVEPDWARISAEQARLNRPEALVVMCGNYERDPATKKVTPRDGQLVSQTLDKSRAIGKWNGVSLYLYEQLSDDQITALASGVFSQPAIPSWHRA
jgi:uncharacterized lipoprotein YddW (UPF0748 family)